MPKKFDNMIYRNLISLFSFQYKNGLVMSDETLISSLMTRWKRK